MSLSSAWQLTTVTALRAWQWIKREFPHVWVGTVANLLSVSIAAYSIHYAVVSGATQEKAIKEQQAALDSTAANIKSTKDALGAVDDSLKAAALAMATAADAIRNGTKAQQGVLVSSQKALESVGHGIVEQQRLLTGVQKNTEAQVAILGEQQRRDLEKASRAPKISSTLSNLNLIQNKSVIAQVTLADLSKLTLVLRNDGSAPLLSPTVIIVAQPESVRLGSPSAVADVRHPNILQLGGVPVEPFSVVHVSYRYEFSVDAPADIHAVTFIITVFGSNMAKEDTGVELRLSP